MAAGGHIRTIRGMTGRIIAIDNNTEHTVIMFRTQISLSQEDYDAAKAEAVRLGMSLASS